MDGLYACVLRSIPGFRLPDARPGPRGPASSWGVPGYWTIGRFRLWRVLAIQGEASGHIPGREHQLLARALLPGGTLQCSSSTTWPADTSTHHPAPPPPHRRRPSGLRATSCCWPSRRMCQADGHFARLPWLLPFIEWHLLEAAVATGAPSAADLLA